MMLSLIAAVIVGTWNGNWFPSGRAEHRANPKVEAATIAASAEMLAEGIRKMDPEGTNDLVLVLNEMRGPAAVSNLIAGIGRKGLRLATISGYRRRDRFDQQQDAIATTLPVAESGWARWGEFGEETPPRGYAFAAVVVEPAVTTRVYAVHLKSNYGAKDEALASQNRAKRTKAMECILGREPLGKHVIIAGDFNADKWRKSFAAERIFLMLEAAGFGNALAELPARKRGTYPHKRYGDSALDYIMYRGFRLEGKPLIEPNDELSDHYAVFAIVTPKADER